MARQVFTARDLNGLNVYHLHEKNQTIYYDNLTKTGYIITNALASKFSTWQLRLPLSIFIAAVFVLLQFNVFIALAVGIVCYAILNFFFHKKFLADCPVQSNFKKPKSLGFVRDIASKYPAGALRIFLYMFLIMTIVMIVDLIVEKLQGSALIITSIFIGISFICTAVVYYILYIKLKENL